MKTCGIFLLSGLASAAVLDTRQAKGFQTRPLNVAFVENLEPSIKDRPSVIRQIVGFGPINLVSEAIDLPAPLHHN
jgi:hypothetical protein